MTINFKNKLNLDADALKDNIRWNQIENWNNHINGKSEVHLT